MFTPCPACYVQNIIHPASFTYLPLFIFPGRDDDPDIVDGGSNHFDN